MANAKRDANFKPSAQAVSKIDLKTPVNIKVNPVNNGVVVEVSS